VNQQPTPYPELNLVLQELVTRIQAILGVDFVGAYLQGSFALGDFDPHSDVDFMVVINEELTSAQVNALQVMHDQVYQLESTWAQHLEGSYIPRDILCDPEKKGLELWFLDHGASSLFRSNHCNTLLVRWVVREKGVRLDGPDPKTLMASVSRELLRAEMYATLNDYGSKILADPQPYNNRFYQGYIVLNWCRMLHDLQRGYPGSKRSGAEWAKASLDPRWVNLIDASWETRPDPASSVRQPADPAAFEETLEFLRYILEESRQYAEKGWPDRPSSSDTMHGE